MEFIKNNKNLIILLIVTAICLYFSIGHVANIFIDVGREIYYPKEILDGKILYKDLFCIYGPLSYQINAIAYKIFGESLNTLYLMGSISTFLIVGFIYLIANKFLSKQPSFIITLFVILTGCLSTRIFNFTLPYSYAVVYGLVSFLISIYFLITYVEDKKDWKLLVASAFCGFAIVNKYDFLPYIIPVLFVIFKTKNLKLILKSLLFGFLSIFVPFLILFIQGLQIKNLIDAMTIIKDFANTETLKTFYVTQGVYYTKRLWGDWIFKIIINLIYLSIIFFGVWCFDKKNWFLKSFGIFLCLLVFYIMFPVLSIGDYLFLTFLTTICFLFGFKKNTLAQNLFIISSILISLKSFWGLSHGNYGLYYVGVILISFFIFLSNNFSDKINKTVSIFLLFMSIIYAHINLIWLNEEKTQIITDKGKLYTLKGWGEPTNELINYLNNLKEKNPKIVVFPEGLSINFLTSKENEIEGFYNSLIPLYVESFGDDKLIDYYKKDKPDYIIFSNFPSNDYGASEICNTYAFRFCSFVMSNYEPVERFVGIESEKYLVLKKK